MSFIKRILKSKLAQDGIWMLILQIFNVVMPILTLPYITRIFSTTAYGEFSVVLNWISYFQIIVEYGFRLSGTKKVAMRKTDAELSIIRGNIIYARLFLTLICAIILVIVVLFAHIEKSQIIYLFILFIMVIALTFQQNWFFQGISEMKNITVISVISRSISIVLIFLFVQKPQDIYLYCFLNVSSWVINSLIGCIIVRMKYKVTAKFNGISEVFNELKDGWSLFISNAMGSIFGSIGVTILSFISANHVVGIYSAVNKIPYALNLIFWAVSQALYPRSCKAFSTSFDTGLKFVKKYSTPVIVFFSVCGFVIVLFRDIIVKIAFGGEYIQGSGLLLPFIIWNILGIMNNFLGIQTLVASGYQREYSRAFTFSMGVMFVLMVFFGRIWSAFGIAWASACSELFLTTLLIYYIQKIRKGTMVK